MSREQNRRAMPKATAMFDEARALWPDARIRWARENGGEIGKRPALESQLFEISAESFDLLRKHAARAAKGRGK